mmetsp:Transcript_2399/g.3366  ORF Transcript_2399/g.3366 Transcript_2399/m.3366 type:complete len:221 (-) Transcript_2399:155-817(-)
MDALAGRDSNGHGSTFLRTPPLVGGWLNATPLLTGPWRIPSITLPNTMCHTTLFMPRDTHPSEMPRIPFQFQRMDPHVLLTLSLRVIRHHGWTMLPSARDVSLVLPIRMDLPRLNVVFTWLELKRPLIVIYGRKEKLSPLLVPMRPSKLPPRANLLSLPFMLHGASTVREWKKNMPSLLKKLPESMFTSSGEMRYVNLSRKILTPKVSPPSTLSRLMDRL